MMAALYSRQPNGRIVEVDALGYKRQPITNGEASFPPASVDWPPLTHFAVVFSEKDQPKFVMKIVGAPYYLTIGNTCSISVGEIETMEFRPMVPLDDNGQVASDIQPRQPHSWMDDWPEVIE